MTTVSRCSERFAFFSALSGREPERGRVVPLGASCGCAGLDRLRLVVFAACWFGTCGGRDEAEPLSPAVSMRRLGGITLYSARASHDQSRYSAEPLEHVFLLPLYMLACAGTSHLCHDLSFFRLRVLVRRRCPWLRTEGERFAKERAYVAWLHRL